ncbi:MAG: hypothetical protein IKC47_05210 [Clostridia bacterium]|nr:hypothetical protein [Clostridia bacterium]
MKNNYFTVLDFGSSKITAMSATRVGHDFVIKAVGQADYNGFDENGWYEPEALTQSVKTALDQVQEKLNIKIKQILVGVPGNFCTVATSEATNVFGSKKKIDFVDLNDIVDKANIFANATGKVVGKSAVYYLLDGAIKTYDPIGSIAQRLTGLVSYSFMDKQFEQTVTQALNQCGVNKISFTPVCEHQARFVSANRNVNGHAIVIDIGHITSNVMLLGGNSLLFAKTFALGSGYIASDLYSLLDVSFETALALLNKINLKLEFKQGDCYKIGTVACDSYKTNEIVKARIEQFADYVKKCFAYCDKEIPSDTPIILTGGGLTYLQGGAEWLSYYLGKRIHVYTSTNPQTTRNEYTSCYGLLQYANTLKQSNRGLFSFLKK